MSTPHSRKTAPGGQQVTLVCASDAPALDLILYLPPPDKHQLGSPSRDEPGDAHGYHAPPFHSLTLPCARDTTSAVFRTGDSMGCILSCNHTDTHRNKIQGQASRSQRPGELEFPPRDPEAQWCPGAAGPHPRVQRLRPPAGFPWHHNPLMVMC